MKIKLKACLESSIQDWINDNCEGDEWPDAAFVTSNLTEIMASAAEAVFDASLEAYNFGLKTAAAEAEDK